MAADNVSVKGLLENLSTGKHQPLCIDCLEMRFFETHLPVSQVLEKFMYSRSYPYALGAGLWRSSGDFSYDTVRHENQERDPCLLRVRRRMSHSEPVLSPVPSPQRLSTSRSTSPTRGSLSAALCTWRCWPRCTYRSLSSRATGTSCDGC